MALTPSLVEIVYALDLGPRLVGVTSFASYPKDVSKVPKVGDFLQPNVEVITRLGPDLVLLDAVQVNADAALRAAGIRTVAIPIESVDDVRRAILRVGEVTGRGAQARALLHDLDRDLAEASVQVRGRSRPRVLFAVDRELGSLRSLVCAGPDTYIDELIHRAGGQNVLGDARLRFFRVSPEEVVSRRPDVIIDAVHTTDVQRARADWQRLGTVPAVQQGRVYALGDPAFVTPGPRLGQMLRRLAALLHPTADQGRSGAGRPPRADPAGSHPTGDQGRSGADRPPRADPAGSPPTGDQVRPGADRPPRADPADPSAPGLAAATDGGEGGPGDARPAPP